MMHTVSAYSDLDEMIVSDAQALRHAATPLPKENVVVPRFRVLTDAECAAPAAPEPAEADGTDAEPETEASACADERIAQRHVPLEILERSQIIRLRNLSVAAFVLALRAHREACADAAAARALPPLPPAPAHPHHLFDALPAPEKARYLDALREQLLRLTYTPDVRPDAETSWDAMQARCAAAAASASSSTSSSSHHAHTLRPGSESPAAAAARRRSTIDADDSARARRRSRAEAEAAAAPSQPQHPQPPQPRASTSTSSDAHPKTTATTTAITTTTTVKSPSRRRTAPPPLKRVCRGDTARAVECPAEVRTALDHVHRPGDAARWAVVKLRPQMHPSTHRPRNVLYLHCAPAPDP